MGLNFVSLYSQWDLTLETLKISSSALGEPEGERKRSSYPQQPSITNNPCQLQHRSKSLKDARGIPVGDIFTPRTDVGGAGIFKPLLQEQKSWKLSFLCLPPPQP